MTRLMITAALLLGIALGAFLLPVMAQPPNASRREEPPKQAGQREEVPLNSATVMGLLKKPMEVQPLVEKTRLRQALEYLSERMGLEILVDKEAFSADLGPDSDDINNEEVALPATPKKWTTINVLRAMLAQIGRGRGTFLIRQGQIVIVPEKNATSAYLLYKPSIVATFEQRQLKDVLQDLTDETGLTINFDPAIGKKTAMPISAAFRNNTLEDALVTITEMAELKYVVLERSIYVTTQSAAVGLEIEEKKREERRAAVRESSTAN